ncbi:unnamed protein product [Mycena citricolor]|uniref:Uncharacterized protein n=1 Tax=Mycena citricolor TaxID=2018698 RepID=A0AAD2K4E5_9AGAR|nr:unnamed protein product [Mycena citricolor]
MGIKAGETQIRCMAGEVCNSAVTYNAFMLQAVALYRKYGSPVDKRQHVKYTLPAHKASLTFRHVGRDRAATRQDKASGRR